jgi:hypothetical protein
VAANEALRGKAARPSGRPSDVPSGSHHTGDESTSRSNGTRQSTRVNKSWKDVGRSLPKQWTPVKHGIDNLRPSKPTRRPLPIRRTKEKNEAICRAFGGLSTTEILSQLYCPARDPGLLKPIVPVVPLTQENLRKHNSSHKRRPNYERKYDSDESDDEKSEVSSAPSSGGGSDSGSSHGSSVSSGSSVPSTIVAVAPVQPVWQRVDEPCVGVYGNPEIRRYRARMRLYDVPVGRFRGLWRSELVDARFTQAFGLFMRGEVVSVRLPEAAVCHVGKYWAHTRHDDKLESFLVSVTKTKAVLSEIHFDDPEDEVVAAMYIPVLCYMRWWSEQQALNSVVRQTTTSRSWLWTVPLTCTAATVGLAVGHVAVPVMLTASIISGVIAAIGAVYHRNGTSLTTRYLLPVVRN